MTWKNLGGVRLWSDPTTDCGGTRDNMDKNAFQIFFRRNLYVKFQKLNISNDQEPVQSEPKANYI